MRRKPKQTELPAWLPCHMRYTATPAERLGALLFSMAELARANDRIRLATRARKIQHLCLQINPSLRNGVPDYGLSVKELLQSLSLGSVFLAAGPPEGRVILSIYECATLLGDALGRRHIARTVASQMSW